MKKGRNVMQSRRATVNRHFDSRFSFLKLARRVPPTEDEKGHSSRRLGSRVSHMRYTYKNIIKKDLFDIALIVVYD